MGISSSTKTAVIILGSLAVIFIGMIIWSYNSGTEIVDETIPEEVFEKEAVSSPHATFELDRTTPIQLSVDGATLDDSWLWVKTVIADENNRPVADYTFDLSYYSGSGWSEGDPDASKTLVLPAGTYKIIAYGEDPKQSKGWTDESRERLNISVTEGVKLSRWPIAGLILTIVIGFVYLAIKVLIGAGSMLIDAADSSGEIHVEAEGLGDGDDF